MANLAFKPTEDITFVTVEENRRRLLSFCRDLESENFTLDLSDVGHCDSAGLAFLIEAKRLAHKYNKKCHIDSMSKAIRALAEFCGVEELLAI